MSTPQLNLRRLTDPGEQAFFGYYDIPAFSPDGMRHLVLLASFRDRLPAATDLAQLAEIDLRTGARRIFAATAAWNFQQGAMLQWLGGSDDTVIYNTLDAAGTPRACIHTLAPDSCRTLARPIATVAADGHYALSINFERMYDFRPGYGYCGRVDPWKGERHPANDGLHHLDLVTGASRLVLSYAQLHARLREFSPLFEGKLLINHVNLAPGGRRWIALARCFPVPRPPGEKPADASQPRDVMWHTCLLTGDLAGGDLHYHIRAGYASHYHWRDDRTLACHCDGPTGPGLYQIDDVTGRFTALDPAFFRADGHCSYSPDKRWLLYDRYPNAELRQHLYLYDLQAHRGLELTSLASLPVALGDIRCDLHPRWAPDSRHISLDSSHEGFRALYCADLGLFQSATEIMKSTCSALLLLCVAGLFSVATPLRASGLNNVPTADISAPRVAVVHVYSAWEPQRDATLLTGFRNGFVIREEKLEAGVDSRWRPGQSIPALFNGKWARAISPHAACALGVANAAPDRDDRRRLGPADLWCLHG